MKSPIVHTLVLMRPDAEGAQSIFAGDLYAGRSIVDSVYLDRTAMLRWLTALDAEASRAAARAMDELLTQPDRVLRSVPVCPDMARLPG